MQQDAPAAAVSSNEKDMTVNLEPVSFHSRCYHVVTMLVQVILCPGRLQHGDLIRFVSVYIAAMLAFATCMQAMAGPDDIERSLKSTNKIPGVAIGKLADAQALPGQSLSDQSGEWLTCLLRSCCTAAENPDSESTSLPFRSRPNHLSPMNWRSSLQALAPLTRADIKRQHSRHTTAFAFRTAPWRRIA